MITVDKGKLFIDGEEGVIIAEYLTLTSVIFNEVDLSNFNIEEIKNTINMIMNNKNGNEIRNHYANKEFDNLKDELGIRRFEDGK